MIPTVTDTSQSARKMWERLPSGIDGSRTDLAEEFRANPFGRHSPDLQALLAHMRGAPIPGKHFLWMIEPHSRWSLAQFSDEQPVRGRKLPDHVFDTIEEAEWFVFRLRWRALFGSELEES